VLGDLAWRARHDSRKSKNMPSLAIGPGKVYLAWELP